VGREHPGNADHVFLFFTTDKEGGMKWLNQRARF
jgi:hypothetical protein